MRPRRRKTGDSSWQSPGFCLLCSKPYICTGCFPRVPGQDPEKAQNPQLAPAPTSAGYRTQLALRKPRHQLQVCQFNLPQLSDLMLERKCTFSYSLNAGYAASSSPFSSSTCLTRVCCRHRPRHSESEERRGYR